MQRSLNEKPCVEGIPFAAMRADLTALAMEAAQRGKLDTSWLIKHLTDMAPAHVQITREPLRLWRKKGVLRDVTKEHPDLHSALALLIARRLHHCLPEIVQAAKELVLKILAYERLQAEEQVVPWWACP